MLAYMGLVGLEPTNLSVMSGMLLPTKLKARESHIKNGVQGN